MNTGENRQDVDMQQSRFYVFLYMSIYIKYDRFDKVELAADFKDYPQTVVKRGKE